jgi:prepilin-type N-terminal cleavage/methylation domain-containing protein
MRKRIFGFTLIELMIVIAIIAIIAAIAIPGLLRARMASHEGNASASLRSMASAQASFQKANSCAQDKDSQGEYGLLNELTGQASLRARGIPTGRPPAPVADFPAAMKADSANIFQGTTVGMASKAGYYFQMYLPGLEAETPLTDIKSATVATLMDFSSETECVVIEQQEIHWICYSWPTTFKSSGLRCFAVDQSAQVYAFANTIGATNDPYFDGTNATPNYDTAMSNLNATPNPLLWTEVAVRLEENCVGGSMLWVESQ